MKHIMLRAILHFFNVEIVCSVNQYHPPHLTSFMLLQTNRV